MMGKLKGQENSNSFLQLELGMQETCGPKPLQWNAEAQRSLLLTGKLPHQLLSPFSHCCGS